MTTSSRYQGAVEATLSGILDRLRRRAPIGRLTAGDRLDGLTALVTGANVGLGKAIAVDLARRGADLLLACRTQDEGARAEVAAAGTGRAELLSLDLASSASVDRLCEVLMQRQTVLHRVVLNAGVVPSRCRLTENGLEEGFQVNYLANVLLLRRLLDSGVIPNKTYAGRDRHRSTARVIFVSSEAHRSAPPLDWAHLGQPYDYDMRQAVAEYGKNKLLLSTYAAELARRLSPQGTPDVAVHSLCPGAVNTRIAREAPRWSQPLLSLVFALFFAEPERAVAPVSYLACARAIEQRTGIYLHGMAEKPLSEEAAAPENGARLWTISEDLLQARCSA